MIRRSGILKNIALLLFGVFVALVLVESALRVTGWLFLQAREPARLSSSSDPAGTIRILCLGESTTADMRLLGKESYPAQLQRILNERTGSEDFVVINGGVPATTTDRIVEKLPAMLDQHRPDIVVTMMGINDGPLADPLYTVSSSSPSLRVWKLAKVLYASLFREGLEDGAVDPDGRVESLQVAEIPHVDGKIAIGLPHLTMLSLKLTGEMLFDGRFEEAEPILIRHANGSLEGAQRWPTTWAVGQLVMLYYQRGDEVEGAKYYERYRELIDVRQNPKTTTNYTILKKLVAQRGLPLVAVQYPGRSIAPLKHLLQGAPNVALVDNEATFMDEVKTGPLRKVYRDLFAGSFGHLTPYGNELLATNVADVIFDLVQYSVAVSDE